MAPPRPLVVQQSFPDPRSTTNPYIVMLRDALAATPGLRVRTFSWRRALFGRYDVFHVHWPDILVSGRDRPRSAARQLQTALLLLRLRLTRTPIVRTLHNLERPRGLSVVATAVLGQLERQTAYVIMLNTATPTSGHPPSAVIAHGHYRDWFARYPQPAAVSGRFAYFGLIRPYKGVDRLFEAFTRLSGAYSLWAAGKPSSAELRESLERLAARDGRIRLTPEFLSDEELVRVAREGELVVLPYREMHNSGGVLAALSLARPVLVPRNEVNQLLGAEVGPGWVHQYDGELTPDVLESALAAVRSEPREAEPDLSARAWELAGRQHLEAYERAIDATRARGRIDRPGQRPS